MLTDVMVKYCKMLKPSVMEQLGLMENGIYGQTNSKSIAKTLLNRWRKDPLQPFNYL